MGDRVDPLQDREDPGQEARVAGEDLRDLDRVPLVAHPAAQRIDGPVEGLVRDLLPLVAPRAEDEGVGVLDADPLGEVTDEGALPDPGLAADQGHRPVARVDPLQGLVEDRDLGPTSHEADLSAARRGRGPARRVARSPDPLRREWIGARRAQALHDLDPPRPRVGLDAGEGRGERVEVGWHPVDPGAGWGWALLLLPGQDLRDAPRDRELSGQALEEEDPEGVPVGGRAAPVARGLLGSHVGQGAHDDRLAAGLQDRGVGVLDEAEVEEHHATPGRHEDVRGLHVPVDLARAVESQEPLGELEQRRAQAIEVGQGPAPGSLDDGRRAVSGRGAFGEDQRRDVVLRDPSGVDPARVVSRRERPPHVLRERDPVDELHGEEPLGALAVELVELDEVRMLDLGQRPELALEAVERLPVHGADEGLERDRLVGLPVPGLVDDSHAPRADRPEDLETLGSEAEEVHGG